MTNIAPAAQLFITLAKSQAMLNRRFNSGLVGLGFSEFVLMFYLGQAEEMKMRRIDLAASVGLTPSGVTRLLAPMEKTGLVKRELNARDARVSLVTLTASGKRQLSESLDELERLADDLLPQGQHAQVKKVTEFLEDIVANAH